METQPLRCPTTAKFWEAHAASLEGNHFGAHKGQEKDKAYTIIQNLNLY